MRLVWTISLLLLILIPSAQCQQTTGDWFDKGLALFSQGKYDEAVQAYDEAIRLDPSHAEIWVNKGLALRNLVSRQDHNVVKYI